MLRKDTDDCKILRGLPLSSVVCFVSQEVKKYGKAYESLKAIAFRLKNVQSPFEFNTETLTTNFQNCIRKNYSVYNI